MPAHIGIADKLRASRDFVIANISLSRKFRHARRFGGGAVLYGQFKRGYLKKRDSRAIRCLSYDTFRENLDRYDPALYANGERRKYAGEAEWDLYLKPDTWFGVVCRNYFDVFRGVEMLLISHKSDINKLKRIECTPRGEAMRVIWSDAR